MGFGLNIAQPATSGISEALRAGDDYGNSLNSGNVGGLTVNLGEMLKPFIQGSPENGGSGLIAPSRYALSTSNLSLSDSNSYGSMYAEKNIFQKYPYYFLGAGALGIVAFLYFKR